MYPMKWMEDLIPFEWLPDVRMDRIIPHWTAGGHIANAVDLRAYHLLVQGDLSVVRGRASIALNSGSLKSGYAAHTLNCNTNSIGLSMCGMAGAIESPFNAGRAPITEAQFRRAAQVAAILCWRYSIPVTRRTVLFHAEVQQTLGITQRFKWDVAILPWAPQTRGAIAIGDMFRNLVAEFLEGAEKGESAPAIALPAPEADPIPEGAQARTTASSLNFRSGPGTGHSITGKLPEGTLVEVEEIGDGWLRVKTPAGHVGWVSRQHVEIVDGPPATEPSKPHPLRQKIAQARALLDEIEAALTE